MEVFLFLEERRRRYRGGGGRGGAQERGALLLLVVVVVVVVGVQHDAGVAGHGEAAQARDAVTGRALGRRLRALGDCHKDKKGIRGATILDLGSTIGARGKVITLFSLLCAGCEILRLWLLPVAAAQKALGRLNKVVHLMEKDMMT